MSGPSIYPALAIKPPDVINALQEYANVGKTDAETGLTKAQTVTEGYRPANLQAQTGLVGAQTAKAQIENELAKIGLGVSQYYLDQARGGGNAGNEPLPGMASEGSSYSAQPDVDPARYAKAAPPPTPAQQAVVDAAADKYGVPKEVAYWVGTHESNWNRDAVGSQTSSGRARGAWQFMDATAKDYNLADPTDFASSTDAAMHYLADLHAKTGDWGSAIQHYGTFSTGQGAGRDAAVRQGWQSYASEHGLGQAPAPYKVAGAPQPPPSGGQPAPVPGAAPAAGGGGGPNALAQGNPMGTSSNGRMMPGLGVAVPLGTALSIASATDKIGAITKALTERRATLAQLAGSATDPAAWNNNVAQAWRVGYLTNGEFQQYYNHFELRDAVVRSLATPEAQTGYQEKLFDKGFQTGQNGQPVFNPALTQGKDPITVKRPVIGADGKQVVDAQGVPMWQERTYSAPDYHATLGAPGGGAAAPAGGGGTAAAPPPAPAPAVTAPNGGTIAGPGAQTAGPGAPMPSASGTVTAPAPAGTGPVTPPGAGASAPLVPPGAGGLEPGAIGGGPPIETPGMKQTTEVQTEQRKQQIAALGERVKSDGGLVNEAQTGAMHSQTAIPAVLDLRNRVAALPANAFGAWGQERAALDNILQTVSPDAANKWATYLSGHKIDPNNASQLQAARKEFFQLVTSAESQIPGSRIGARLTSYFSDAMPSLNMQKPAVQEMLNFLLVGNQLAVDYAQEMAKHYNGNFASYTQSGSYAPVAQFDQEWTKPGSVHSPAVYEAAARLLNGSGVGQWDKGLTDKQQQEAFSIVSRADPSYHFRRDQLPGLAPVAGR